MTSGLSGLRGGNFLVIGRAGMDLYPDPPGTRIEDGARFMACLGGSSGNIAAALARQDCSVALATCVSDDAVGRFTINELERYGIDHTHVVTIGGEARNTLALSETRLDNCQTVIYRNHAADLQMRKEHLEKIDYRQYAALVTTGTVFAAEPSRSAVFAAFKAAKSAGVPLVFDIDYRPYSWASAEEATETYSAAGAVCDIIIGNDVEFGFMAGSYEGGLQKARDLARTTAQIVVYKMGEKGAVTITADREFRTGVFEVPAIKPTGAGDSFMGGFLAALAAGIDLETAVSRGAASASIVVTRPGCAPAMPSTSELNEFLATHPGPALPQ